MPHTVFLCFGLLLLASLSAPAEDTIDRERQYSKLMLLDEFGLESIAAPSTTDAHLSLETGAKISLKMCVDEMGHVYDLQVLDAPDRETAQVFRALAENLRFKPLRQLENEVCLESRMDFLLLDAPRQRWMIQFWEEEFFQASPHWQIPPSTLDGLELERTTNGPLAIDFSISSQETKPVFSAFLSKNEELREYTKLVSAFTCQLSPSDSGKKVSVAVQLLNTDFSFALGNIRLVMTLKPITSPPKWKKPPTIRYPEELKYANIVGNTTMRWILNEDGKIEDLQIVSATSRPFALNVLKALEKSTMEPGKVDGKPVKFMVQQSFDFSMGSQDGAKEKAFQVKKKPAEEYFQNFPRFDTMSEPIKIVDPVYPYELLLKGKEGKAVIGCVVDTNGRPTNLIVAESKNDPAFGQSALAALARFEFIPAKLGQEPVISALTWTFEFSVSRLWPWEEEALRKIRTDALPIAKISELESKPTVRFKNEIIFPWGESFQEKKGSATISLLVDPKGRVLLPKIEECSNPIVGYALANNVATWRFHPGRKDGKPVMTRVRVPIAYDLEKQP